MAAVASLLPWPWLGFSEDFICIETSITNECGGFSENFTCIETSNTDYECVGLYLNTPTYWSGDFSAARAAAVFAIFSTALGFVAFSLLATATCFELAPRRILTVIIMQGIAAFCSILTLIAGAVDVCNGLCSQQMHIATGAGFEIFAFLIYLAAIAVTLLWYRELRREATPKEEARSLVGSAPRLVSVSTISMPDGGQRIEREYMDETGQVIKEVTVTRPDQQQQPPPSPAPAHGGR